jgi:hypothetical protein
MTTNVNHRCGKGTEKELCHWGGQITNLEINSSVISSRSKLYTVNIRTNIVTHSVDSITLNTPTVFQKYCRIGYSVKEKEDNGTMRGVLVCRKRKGVICIRSTNEKCGNKTICVIFVRFRTFPPTCGSNVAYSENKTSLLARFIQVG